MNRSRPYLPGSSSRIYGNLSAAARSAVNVEADRRFRERTQFQGQLDPHNPAHKALIGDWLRDRDAAMAESGRRDGTRRSPAHAVSPSRVHAPALAPGQKAQVSGARHRPTAHQPTAAVQQTVLTRNGDVFQLGAIPESHDPPSNGTPSTSSRTMMQKACNFYVYDSTERSGLGTLWGLGAATWAMKARGGYSVASGDTIEQMLTRVLDKIADKRCDCFEEMQLWSHGSPGNAGYISKSGDEITAADFEIPGLAEHRDVPSLNEMVRNTNRYQTWREWFRTLTPRQQLFVELRSYVCAPDTEIYYRSCSAFQGTSGQEFAEKSADFWQASVIGHTKLIGLTQPGRKVLHPGQRANWPETEGETTEMKKRGTKPKKL